MADTKFTPGPWHIYKLTDISRIADVHERMIASLVGIEANAALIAAAPELYEALVVFMQYIDHSHLCPWKESGWRPDCDCGFYEAVEKIEDALRKARGE